MKTQYIKVEKSWFGNYAYEKVTKLLVRPCRTLAQKAQAKNEGYHACSTPELREKIVRFRRRDIEIVFEEDPWPPVRVTEFTSEQEAGKDELKWPR